MVDAPSDRAFRPERPLSDAEMWRGVAATVLDVLLPAIDPDQEWARAAAVQLVGLARYAAERPVDPTDERAAELVGVLGELADNPLVAANWDGNAELASVMEGVGAVLAAAIGRHDEAADEVRRRLRPVAVRQLDDELAVTGPLVNAFRGGLDDGAVDDRESR